MRKKILVLLAALLAMTMSALLYANSLGNSAFALKVITEEPRSKIPCWSAGGVSLENPELGKKVSSLLIDSIEAKLSILKKVGNA